MTEKTSKNNGKDVKKEIKELKKEQQKTRRQVKCSSKMTVLFALSAIGAVFVAFGFVDFESLTTSKKIQTMDTGFIIENLRGDTVNVWVAWIIPENIPLYVNIVDTKLLSEEQMFIKKVFSSTESIEVDNSILHKGPEGTYSNYYVGWNGALEQASDIQTKHYIPQRFEFVDASNIAGDIVVKFTKSHSGVGDAGFTKVIADDAKNQILKAEITIYAVDTLSNSEFEAILRHEIGHALGLAHSTAPQDLMHPTLPEKYPYVSDCDIDALIKLYNGSEKSQVVCES